MNNIYKAMGLLKLSLPLCHIYACNSDSIVIFHHNVGTALLDMGSYWNQVLKGSVLSIQAEL